MFAISALLGIIAGIITYSKQHPAIPVKKTVTRKRMPPELRQFIIDKYHNTCQNCQRVGCCSPHVDHITPLAAGGTDDIENLQLLCAYCNLHKGTMHPLTFKKEYGTIKELQ